MAEPEDPTATDFNNRLTRMGGGFSLIGVAVAIAILVTACAGFDGVLRFAIDPVILGSAGLILGIIPLFRRHHDARADSITLAGLFTAAIAVGGGLLEMAAAPS